MRLLIQHHNRYRYPRPAALGPHVVRLRPANHTKAKVETYGLHIEQEHALRWQQDPYGNHVARITFKDGTRLDTFDVRVELTVDIRPVNPFDFFVDDRCTNLPFEYPREFHSDLIPFLDRNDASLAGGPRFDAFLESLPREGATVPFVIEVNRRVNELVRYVIREEAGVYTPEETLRNGRGSCRDSAVLLIAALRSRGLATRFVSGYLIQLADEGMIPDAPRGVGRDVVDLHAWAEVYIPGAGWIGLDATSGLLCGEGHIPLACTAAPALASPIDGTADVAAESVSFEMKVGRLGHEPRPTAPYEESEYAALLDAGDRVDALLEGAGLTVTMGGEPTFNAREHVDAPEWNGDALGPTKWAFGLELANELRARLAPGGLLLVRQGKHYPGESLPRWALDLCSRRDGVPLWSGPVVLPNEEGSAVSIDDARRLVDAIAERLGLAAFVLPAHEDPWPFVQDEASLPVGVDPLSAKLSDPEERRRLAKVLERGLAREAGFVLPLGRVDGRFVSERWSFKRGHLFLLHGDSPIGLRLPLRSLPNVPPPPPLDEQEIVPPDPRREAELARIRQRTAEAKASVRTALTVEPRGDALHIFLPPMPDEASFVALVGAIDAARGDARVILEGYGPPPGSAIDRFAVTPDPGVLEVNLPPTRTTREYAKLIDTVFDAALHSGLHSEKYLLDGRQAGSGGGNHLTLGGPSALESPFLKRPELLASLITFVQHHPSLSYLFTGLFVGPTSQAPRVDEARHDALYELEIALAHAHGLRGQSPPPWTADALFRHLLVDVSGNTHRTEICIDKLFDPLSPYGRQGLVELRAFEMPPHPRMIVAQMTLVRALIASFAREPYQRPLVRWGQALHDRFLLPYFLWRDLEDVLAHLERHGIDLPVATYRPFVELRCPLVGTLQAGDVTIEVRNAIEPWHVLGEEPAGGGTTRYVDSSMERIEVRARGLVPGRHTVVVNGLTLPMSPTEVANEHVAGVRFRAWAPPHSLQPHLGIHHPIHIDVVDEWGKRSLGACAYHVWHPEGRAFLHPPLTRFEAAARRAQRFTIEGPLSYPVTVRRARPHPDAPYTLDLRRFPGDRPPPEPEATDS